MSDDIIFNSNELHDNLLDPEKSKYIQEKVEQLKKDAVKIEMDYQKVLIEQRDYLRESGVREDSLALRTVNNKIEELERCEKSLLSSKFLTVYEMIENEKVLRNES